MNYDLICHEIKFDLAVLRDTLEEFFNTLPDLSSKFEKQTHEMLKGIDDEMEYRAEASILYQQHYQKYEEIFPDRLSYSFIISLYSSLEYNLKKICNDIKDRRKLPFSLEVFEGDLSKKVLHFFKGFNINVIIGSDFQRIKEITLIRNNIAHNDGYVDTNEKKLIRFCKAKKGISIEANKLRISNEFCYEYQEYFLDMFRRIFNKSGYKTDYTITVIK